MSYSLLVAESDAVHSLELVLTFNIKHSLFQIIPLSQEFTYPADVHYVVFGDGRSPLRESLGQLFVQKGRIYLAEQIENIVSNNWHRVLVPDPLLDSTLTGLKLIKTIEHFGELSLEFNSPNIFISQQQIQQYID